MKKRLLSTIAAFSLFAAVAFVPSVSAESKSYNSGGKGFARAWQVTDQGGSGFNTWEVRYGFNKWAIDEDFIHGFHDSKGHAVKLTNGNSTYSDSDNGGSWSRIDVRHSGNAVYYNFNF